MKSKRFQMRAQFEINKDSFIRDWPEGGLILFNSPCDPKPKIKIEAGRITELDGRTESEFDIIDRFIASRAIDIEAATASMAMESLAIARMLVDIAIPREEIIRIFRGLTPAKIVEVVNCLGVVEMMLAL